MNFYKQELKKRFDAVKRIFAKNDEKSRLLFLYRVLEKEALISVFVVFLGFLLGTILILAIGKNPAKMYSAIWESITGIGRKGFNPTTIGDTLNYVVPLVLCGLSVAFAYKAGLFNIGAEGQYIVGMTTATVCAFYGPKIPFIHPLYCLTMAVIFSSAFGGIVGYLKAKYEVSEVVATIMLNYMALHLSRIIVRSLPSFESNLKASQTNPLPPSVSIEIPLFGKIFKNPYIDALDVGFVITLICIVIYWFITEKTALGFELRATGFNRHAALSSGIPIKKSIILSMAISGAFAGLAGALVAIGTFDYGRILSGMDNYGFNGIAVALIGNCKAIGVLLAGYLFSVLKNASKFMQNRGIPKEIIYIIQGIIVVLISLRAVAIILKNSISKVLARKGDEK